MSNLNIRILDDSEKIPLELLLEADPSEDAIKDYISRGHVYVCEINEIVGIYVLIKTRPHTMELVNISVKDNFQGKGIGRKMMNHAINIAKESGAKVLELGTGNSSIGQLAFYQKLGFRIVGIDKDFFINNYEEEIIENGIKCVDMIRLRINLE